MILKFLIKTVFLLIIVSSISFCDRKDALNPGPVSNMDDLIISPEFNFRTDQETSFGIKALDNNDNPLQGVRIDIYSDSSGVGGYRIISGFTGADGVLSTRFNIPAEISKLYARTKYIGLPDELPVNIINGQVSLVFGGKPMAFKSNGFQFKNATGNWYPMGSWNSQGVPSYLEPERDQLTPAFLAMLNASFPETKSVPVFHPEYLNPQNEQDFILSESCKVYLTFLHEGAGYKNVLLYYTYNADNPPQHPSQIDSMFIILPNVSYNLSGGGLYSGDKVFLGTFAAGTGIGFAVIADGFKTNTVTSGKAVYYSEPSFNPEFAPEDKQHSVVLIESDNDLFIMGFEDLRRSSGSDDDFNDVMFSVRATPIDAVDTTGFPPVVELPADTDEDGVPDIFDDYPEDEELAFDNFYPGENIFGTLVFEDLWPVKGDYDFNDLVLDYNFNQITNFENKVARIRTKIVVKAIGASFRNGFGFQMGSPSESVEYISGQQIDENYVVLNPNGTEASQEKAVVIIFDNAFDILPYPGGGFTGVNTSLEAPYVQPDTLDLIIHLVNALPNQTINLPPYNPFLFIEQDRSREVHLPDQPPTSLQNMALFGTLDDDSDISKARYYKTVKNLPWAMNIVQNFQYPIEKKQILAGYLKFAEWAESSGKLYPDWPADKPGYRNNTFIYIR